MSDIKHSIDSKLSFGDKTVDNKRLYNELLTAKVEQLKKASTGMEASLIARSLTNLIQSYVDDFEWLDR